MSTYEQDKQYLKQKYMCIHISKNLHCVILYIKIIRGYWFGGEAKHFGFYDMESH